MHKPRFMMNIGLKTQLMKKGEQQPNLTVDEQDGLKTLLKKINEKSVVTRLPGAVPQPLLLLLIVFGNIFF